MLQSLVAGSFSPSCTGLPLQPLIHPLDLTKPLVEADFTTNVDLAKPDTSIFERFARAYKQAVELRIRSGHGPSEEPFLVLAFLQTETSYEFNRTTDPRIPYLFAELLLKLEEYAYPIHVLEELASQLPVESPYIRRVIEGAQHAHVRRIESSQMGALFDFYISLALDDASTGLQFVVTESTLGVSWTYKPNNIQPLPEEMSEFRIPIPQFAPFSQHRLEATELKRLLRSVAVSTNIIEGVLHLDHATSSFLIIHGFSAAAFAHVSDHIVPSYVQQVLVDSQRAATLAHNRISHSQEPFTLELVQDLHKAFTRTACLLSMNTGRKGEKESVFIGRGAFKFISNHVFARTHKFHIYCPPEHVFAELNQLLFMLHVRCAFPDSTVRKLIVSSLNSVISEMYDPRLGLVSGWLRGFTTALSTSIASGSVIQCASIDSCYSLPPGWEWQSYTGIDLGHFDPVRVTALACHNAR